MKIPKAILSAVLIIACSSASSQERSLTPFHDDLTKKDIKIILRAVADWQIRTPFAHHTADWTNAALFLASKASDFVNGHILFVDGGILANFGYLKGENTV